MGIEQTIIFEEQESKGTKYFSFKLNKIDNGNFVNVQKVFPEAYNVKGEKNGKKYDFYSCKVKVQGIEASFVLNKKEDVEKFNSFGIDCIVRITVTKEIKTFKYKQNGKEVSRDGVATTFKFEKV